MAIAVAKQAAGQAGVLTWPGERVDPVDQERWRSVHAPADRLVLVCDFVPGYRNIVMRLECSNQALLQQPDVRATGHCEHRQMQFQFLPSAGFA